MTKTSKIESLQNKVYDHFSNLHADNYPFTRVESEESIMIDGTISVGDMKALIKIFENIQD